MIRSVQSTDYKEMLEIYSYYVRETVVTFDEDELSIEYFSKKIENIKDAYPCFVYTEDNKVIGYAYGSKWREKSAYRGSVELTVYFHKDYCRKGFGRVLYQRLMKELFKRGYHVAIAVVTVPNEGSSKLHKALNFTQSGYYSEVGRKFEKWVDIETWHKLLD